MRRKIFQTKQNVEAELEVLKTIYTDFTRLTDKLQIKHIFSAQKEIRKEYDQCEKGDFQTEEINANEKRSEFEHKQSITISITTNYQCVQ